MAESNRGGMKQLGWITTTESEARKLRVREYLTRERERERRAEQVAIAEAEAAEARNEVTEFSECFRKHLEMERKAELQAQAESEARSDVVRNSQFSECIIVEHRDIEAETADDYDEEETPDLKASRIELALSRGLASLRRLFKKQGLLEKKDTDLAPSRESSLQTRGILKRLSESGRNIRAICN